MRDILLIGIGAGNPEHMTLQAIQAMRDTDVFFMLDKRDETADLNLARMELCRRFSSPAARIVHLPDPPRERIAMDEDPQGAARSVYNQTVDAWHQARAELLEDAFARELEPGRTGALLLWGDPAIYDSALRLIERIRERGRLPLNCRIIPGISSIQVLAAAHGIALNRIGEAIHITTGRALTQGFPPGLDAVVVMLDGDCSFTRVMQPDMEIFWGAYLGTEDEILVRGPVLEVADRIQALRAQARQRKGWIMDTYLLRRSLRKN